MSASEYRETAKSLGLTYTDMGGDTNFLEEIERNVGRERNSRKSSNKEFARVTYLFVFLFLAMMAYIVYFYAVRSKDIVNSAYNPRLDSYACLLYTYSSWK